MALLDVVQHVLEPLPVRGKGRLAEQILRHVKTEALTCHPLASLEVRLRRSQRIERLMWVGAYERQILSFLKRTVKPSMTILDVGANIGYIASIAATLAGRTGQVHVFEPNPTCYPQLEENLRPLSQAHAYQLAINDTEGKLPLYLSENQQEDGWGSLLEEPGAGRRPLLVPVTSIDNFVSKLSLRQVDLIKIDIEGNEMHALRGARLLIERDHPMIVAELNSVCLARDGAKPEDVIQFLGRYDYSVRHLDSDNILAVWPSPPSR
jgi:FkbM family methyltransferase